MGNKYQKYREHLTSTHNESEIWAWRNVIVLSFLLNWATAEEMLCLFYLFFQSLLSASQMGDDILMFHSLILFQPLLHNWLKGTYLFSVGS